MWAGRALLSALWHSSGAQTRAQTLKRWLSPSLVSAQMGRLAWEISRRHSSLGERGPWGLRRCCSLLLPCAAILPSSQPWPPCKPCPFDSRGCSLPSPLSQPTLTALSSGSLTHSPHSFLRLGGERDGQGEGGGALGGLPRPARFTCLDWHGAPPCRVVQGDSLTTRGPALDSSFTPLLLGQSGGRAR